MTATRTLVTFDSSFVIVAACFLLSSQIFADGDGTFDSPFVITNAGRPGPATVHSGDLNGDGKLDLVTANGSPRILVYFQSPDSREQWRQLPLPVGSQVWFVRTADFNGDGLDDIIASDISATAFYVESIAGGRFSRPKAIPEARGARWSAIGDWNNDGNVDFATANISAADLTVFLGDGQGDFTFSQRLGGSREHTLEAADYDGDGNLDIFLGTGLTGVTVHQGLGDGTFEVRGAFEHMGCVEYLAEVGHYENGEYIVHGDFNNDGKGDLSPTCVETTSASAGMSNGDATYTKIAESVAGPGVDSSAIADLNGDGNADWILVSKGWTSLLVHLGDGEGELEPEPVVFSPTGDTPVFLIVRDLDRDGFLDVITADQRSSTLTIFWGKDGERFLESAFNIRGFETAKSMATADLNKDGVPDLFFPRSDRGEIRVAFGSAEALPSGPSMTIETENIFTLLEAVDLNGDGTPDLAGANQISGNALAALLDGNGDVSGELALNAGLLPSSVEVGDLNGDETVDIAVPCKGSNHVAIFLGQGDGTFNAVDARTTVARPNGAALGEWDGDGLTDIVVFSDTEIAVHFGKGGGEFGAVVEVDKDATAVFTGVAAGDLNGDSKLDLLVAESKTLSVLVYEGNGTREFGDPVSIKIDSAPSTLVVADLNGDGRPDITTANPNGRSASVLLNDGNLEFSDVVYGLGIVPVGHRLLDLDVDGALDIVGFSASSATVLSGRVFDSTSPNYFRGDADADGKLGITDAISTLVMLFRGGDTVACEDAADADDDGKLGITDPIAMLGHAFLGTGPLPFPGADVCGEDPTDDDLPCNRGCP